MCLHRWNHVPLTMTINFHAKLLIGPLWKKIRWYSLLEEAAAQAAWIDNSDGQNKHLKRNSIQKIKTDTRDHAQILNNTWANKQIRSILTSITLIKWWKKKINMLHLSLGFSSFRIISESQQNVYLLQRSITRDSFWIRFNKKSPCLIVAW